MNTKQLEINKGKLPELCFSHIPDGLTPIVIQFGESGYRRVDMSKYPMALSNARRFVKEMNDKMGVTPAQRSAMQFGSMFGWDTPGADPDSVIHKEAA